MDSLDLLIKYQHQPLDPRTKPSGFAQNKPINEIFSKFRLRYEKATPEYQVMVQNYIKKLPRPTIIKNNTIGSYLFGCLQHYYGDAEKENSLLCFNSLKPEFIHPNKQIWAIRGEKPTRFRQLNYPEKYEHAYVYLEKDFQGFTLKEIEMFHQYGVRTVSLFLTKKMRHIIYKDYSGVPLIKLPLESKQKGVIKSEANTETIKKSDNSYLILFFLILVIMVIGYFIFNGRFYFGGVETSREAE